MDFKDITEIGFLALSLVQAQPEPIIQNDITLNSFNNIVTLSDYKKTVDEYIEYLGQDDDNMPFGLVFASRCIIN